MEKRMKTLDQVTRMTTHDQVTRFRDEGVPIDWEAARKLARQRNDGSRFALFGEVTQGYVEELREEVRQRRNKVDYKDDLYLQSDLAALLAYVESL